MCECATAAGGRRQEERMGVHNQKQEPHTKMWGKKTFLDEARQTQNRMKFIAEGVPSCLALLKMTGAFCSNGLPFFVGGLLNIL